MVLGAYQQEKLALQAPCRCIHAIAEFNHGLLVYLEKASLGPIQIDDQQKCRGVGDHQKRRAFRYCQGVLDLAVDPVPKNRLTMSIIELLLTSAGSQRTVDLT